MEVEPLIEIQRRAVQIVETMIAREETRGREKMSTTGKIKLLELTVTGNKIEILKERGGGKSTQIITCLFG